MLNSFPQVFIIHKDLNTICQCQARVLFLAYNMDKINFKNKVILVIGAHPDDNDFGSAGTSAKAAKEGAKVFYLIATKGQRGGSGKKLTSEKLARIRDKEQQAAAKVLGVKKVHFLDFFDGELVADLKLKEQIVIFIRKYKPDYLFTMDPSRFYYKNFGFINHSDHRAVGEAALDACYPLARDLLSFPQHQSQFPDFKPVRKRITERAVAIGKKAGVKYAEGFIRLKLR